MGDDELVEGGRGRHQDRRREPGPPAGPARLLPGRGHRARVPGQERHVEAADVDTQLERIRRHDAQHVPRAEPTLDLAAPVRKIAPAVAADHVRERGGPLDGRLEVSQDDLLGEPAPREHDGRHAGPEDRGREPARLLQVGPADPELGVDDRRIVEDDDLLAGRRAVLDDQAHGRPDEPFRELLGVGDRGRRADELGSRSVVPADPLEPAEHVGEMAAEDTAVRVELVDDDVAQILEEPDPLRVVRQDPRWTCPGSSARRWRGPGRRAAHPAGYPHRGCGSAAPAAPAPAPRAPPAGPARAPSWERGRAPASPPRSGAPGEPGGCSRASCRTPSASPRPRGRPCRGRRAPWPGGCTAPRSRARPAHPRAGDQWCRESGPSARGAPGTGAAPSRPPRIRRRGGRSAGRGRRAVPRAPPSRRHLRSRARTLSTFGRRGSIERRDARRASSPTPASAARFLPPTPLDGPHRARLLERPVRRPDRPVDPGGAGRPCARDERHTDQRSSRRATKAGAPRRVRRPRGPLVPRPCLADARSRRLRPRRGLRRLDELRRARSEPRAGRGRRARATRSARCSGSRRGRTRATQVEGRFAVPRGRSGSSPASRPRRRARHGARPSGGGCRRRGPRARLVAAGLARAARAGARRPPPLDPP